MTLFCTHLLWLWSKERLNYVCVIQQLQELSADRALDVILMTLPNVQFYLYVCSWWLSCVKAQCWNMAANQLPAILCNICSNWLRIAQPPPQGKVWVSRNKGQYLLTDLCQLKTRKFRWLIHMWSSFRLWNSCSMVYVQNTMFDVNKQILGLMEWKPNQKLREKSRDPTVCRCRHSESSA
jgi:hypothetical protein